MSFDLGDTWALSALTEDANGAAVNGATVTLRITLPDGTTTTPTVTNPPAVTGTYVYDYVPTVAGRHTARWLFTFTGTTATAAYTDTVNVLPADPGGILSLADAKAHLNIPASNTTDDEELRFWVGATTEVVESEVGPTVPRTYSEEVACGPSWWLAQTPVISITSIAAVFTTSPAADFDVTLVSGSGRVRRTDGIPFTGGPWVITYLAGRPILPANIEAAARIILAHLWETQRGDTGGGRMRPSLGLGGSDDYVTTAAGATYAVPRRALELLKRHAIGPMAR